MQSLNGSSRRHVLVRKLLVLTAAAAAVEGGGALAGTLAYWRFEGDGVTVPTNGALLTDFAARTTVQPGGIPGYDSSGNGNTLYGFNNSYAGMKFSTAVPKAAVPLTGAANGFSLQNNGGFPAASTWSREAHPSTDLETAKPLAWTIEASILTTDTTGFRTFVGREGNGVATATGGDLNAAPLYFQTTPGGRLRINFVDEGGFTHVLDDTSGTLGTNSWYNVAAVSDGTTLKLFKDSGLGYTQVGSLALGATTDARLGYDDNGANNAGDTQWGWTVGRGRYGNNDDQNQNHGDRWLGNIDEVRISDAALTPAQFLFAGTVVVNPNNLTWVGAQNAGTWDVNATANFKLPSNAASVFKQNDNATFNGTGATTITIAGAVNPLTMTVSGSVDQTFTGTGSIAGPGSLVKTGTGKLTLANAGGNSFGGGTTISGGIVELTGGTGSGPVLGTGPIVNNGTLVTNRADTLFVPNDISGSGNLDVKNFTVLSGNNTFAGTVLVEAGVLFLDSATALGNAAGGTTVNQGSGLAVYLGGFTIAEPLALDGDGVASDGAIHVGGQRNVTFSGPITLGATAGFVGLSIDGGATINLTGPITSTTAADFYRVGPGTLKMPAINAKIFSPGLQGTTQLTGGAGTIKQLVIPAAETRLDVTRAALNVDYDPGASPFADINAMRVDGRLLTSLGAGFGLAIVDNGTLATPLATLAGIPVDASAVLVRGTYLGDSNLDGGVTFDDLLILAQNYDPAGSGKGWGQGDSNYDNVVNFDDLLALAQNYGQSLSAGQAALIVDGYGGSFASDFALARSLVPEPASSAAIAGVAGLLLGKRRRAGTQAAR